MRLLCKEKKSLYAHFNIDIPIDLTKSSIKNRTVKKFLEKIDPAFHVLLGAF